MIKLKDILLNEMYEIGKVYDDPRLRAFLPMEEKIEEVDDFCEQCLIEVLRGAHPEQLGEATHQGRSVKLGKIMRGDVKKFKVYVRDPKTKNIKKINFGDPNMKIKKNIPARRKSFRARHKCDTAKDRTTPRYWACRTW
jgi:hypothetical protein